MQIRWIIYLDSKGNNQSQTNASYTVVMKHLNGYKNETPIRHTFVQVTQDFHHCSYLNHISTAMVNELFSSAKYIDERIWTIHRPRQNLFFIASFANIFGIQNLVLIKI